MQNDDPNDDLEFEPEDMGDEPTNDEEPFDPRKVDVAVVTTNLGALITRLKHDEIDLFPDFQRSGNLWPPQSQSRLIESILIRLPIPAFYFDAADEDKWQVVDGLQRLSSIKNFIEEKLALSNLEFLKQLEGLRFSQLPRPMQRRIDEFQVSVYLIKKGTPDDVKYSLFKRINTGGWKLTHQEIRHAMSQSINRGAASTFLTKLTKADAFKAIVAGKNQRMAYQELVLRYFAFFLSGHENYKSSLPRFLDATMTALGRVPAETAQSLEQSFVLSLETAYEIFGSNSFRKTLAEPNKKKVVNKPLFEVVAVALSRLSPSARTELINNRVNFLEDFKGLLMDQRFDDAISKSTANKDNVDTRFTMFSDLINRHIGVSDPC